jgi:4-hydroxybenzoate polyprenyltransferase
VVFQQHLNDVVEVEAQGVGVWFGVSTKSTVAMTIAAALWTAIYDTIHAFQDRADDAKVGLKSTVVLFGEWTKLFLTANLAGLIGSLAYLREQ